MTLIRGLIDGNTAADGAGISNFGGTELPDRGALGLVEVTIHRNTAALGGAGAISSRGGESNTLVIGRSTIADNVGGARGFGGVVISSGGAQFLGNVIARNIGDGVTVNCAGTKPVDLGAGVEDENDCGLAGGDQNPDLGTSLRSEGGELDVLPLGEKSPAVDRVPLANCPAGTTDARALLRPQGPLCDAGAYELDKPATVTITEGPHGVTGASVEFRFNASEPSTVQCQLTGPGQSAGFVECYKVNAQPYSGLADGPYTFSVRALDGEFSNPPVTTRSFIVDTGPPNTSITDGPSGTVNSTSAAFVYNSTESGSTFECSLDGADFGACPTSYTGLSQAFHTFRVRAIDAAGNTDQTPDSRTWAIDINAPETAITDGPRSPGNVNRPTFSFMSSESGSSFQCRVDTGAFATCTSPHTTGELADGTHTFEVVATDGAGNPDATPASQTVRIDTADPPPPVVTSPLNNALLMTGTVAFNGTAEPESTVRIREAGVSQGSALASGTGNWTITLGPTDGTHNYVITATDAAGNESDPTNWTITVDTQMPETEIVDGPSGPVNDDTPTFTLASEPGRSSSARSTAPGTPSARTRTRRPRSARARTRCRCGPTTWPATATTSPRSATSPWTPRRPTPRSTPGRAARPPTPRRGSRSAPPIPARRSSAASTARAARPAATRRARRRATSARRRRAPTRCSCAPATPRRTSTTHPPSAPSGWTPRRPP